MKKFFLLIVCALMGISSYAQQEPNRLIVRDNMGQAHPFHVNRIDSIAFATVEGTVAAEISVEDVTIKDEAKGTKDMVKLAITRTPACAAFQIMCVKKANADRITTDEYAEYTFKYSDSKTMYYQDFTAAEMTGFDFAFTPNTDYTIVTLGYDQYGTACEMRKADFRTPNISLVGNPVVKGEVTDLTTSTIEVKFTKTADVKGFAACCFKEGEAQQQLEMFGAWMGFTSIGDMVKAWGFQGVSDTTFVWTDMTPGTKYEVYTVCWDINGTMADVEIIPVTTKQRGGEGVAEVSITIGGSKYYEELDAFTQRVIFTPNENVSVYHACIVTDSLCQADPTFVETYLKDPKMEGSYGWDLYDVDDYEWELYPNAKFVAAAVAKNVNGEWGPVVTKTFTTPEVADETVPASDASMYAPAKASTKMDLKRGIAPRIKKNAPAIQTPGCSPYIHVKRAKKGLELIAR